MFTTVANATRPMAYGVDPTRPEMYSLRQARYHGLGEVVGERIAKHKAEGKPLKLLDIGLWDGVSRRHIESNPGSEIVEFHGVDLVFGPRKIYKHDEWASLHEADLCDGLPFFEDDLFDVVICEQVLEHIHDIEPAMKALARVLKPGGVLIAGVPIFPEGVHLIRKHAVPALDKMLGKKSRSHVQAFSKRTFISILKQNTGVSVIEARGFRLMSGGLLRPLENHRWWWLWNRFLGRTVPSLCTEIQVLATKERKAA